MPSLDDREGLCIIQFCQALYNVQTYRLASGNTTHAEKRIKALA